MSFGGHHALNASNQVQKKLQEAMASKDKKEKEKKTDDQVRVAGCRRGELVLGFRRAWRAACMCTT
jgi:hypothetical protein